MELSQNVNKFFEIRWIVQNLRNNLSIETLNYFSWE